MGSNGISNGSRPVGAGREHLVAQQTMLMGFEKRISVGVNERSEPFFRIRLSNPLEIKNVNTASYEFMINNNGNVILESNQGGRVCRSPWDLNSPIRFGLLGNYAEAEVLLQTARETARTVESIVRNDTKFSTQEALGLEKLFRNAFGVELRVIARGL
jgi:hypothetical protein